MTIKPCFSGREVEFCNFLTVLLIGHDIEIKVRLVGIDALETSKKKGQPGQPYSQKATKYLAGSVLPKVIDIKGYGTDPYNRILGVIFLDGRNINLKLVEAGLAEVYQGKPSKGFDLNPYYQAESEARAGEKGMWALGDDYVSQREWRGMQRQ